MRRNRGKFRWEKDHSKESKTKQEDWAHKKEEKHLKKIKNSFNLVKEETILTKNHPKSQEWLAL